MPATVITARQVRGIARVNRLEAPESSWQVKVQLHTRDGGSVFPTGREVLRMNQLDAELQNQARQWKQ